MRPWRDARMRGIGGRDPDLLAVSRQIRTEAGCIHYKKHQWVIWAEIDELQIATDWLCSLSHKYGPMPFNDLQIVIQSLRWADFQKLLPLIETMRARKLTTQDINMTETSDYPPLRLIISSLSEGLQLGHRAGREGWTAVELKKKFEKWVDEVKLRPKHPNLMRTFMKFSVVFRPIRLC